MAATKLELRNAARLPAPEYTSPAVAAAIARIRREGAGLWRIIARTPAHWEKDSYFGYDLPRHDAELMRRELEFNGYREVELAKI